MLKGRKVILREKRLSDAEKDYAWRRDDELATLDATSPVRLPFSEYLAYYTEELDYPTPGRCRFAIETLDGKHIGNCMYYDVDLSREEAELGVMIGERDYWNKGYGEDAVNTLLEHIFTTVKLNRLYLHTLDWNQRAQRCFQKCGFTLCGRVVRDRKHFVVMEIRRQDWEHLNRKRLASKEKGSFSSGDPLQGGKA